jgi:hypothetical protein
MSSCSEAHPTPSSALPPQSHNAASSADVHENEEDANNNEEDDILIWIRAIHDILQQRMQKQLASASAQGLNTKTLTAGGDHHYLTMDNSHPNKNLMINDDDLDLDMDIDLDVYNSPLASPYSHLFLSQNMPHLNMPTSGSDRSRRGMSSLFASMNKKLIQSGSVDDRAHKQLHQNGRIGANSMRHVISNVNPNNVVTGREKKPWKKPYFVG